MYGNWHTHTHTHAHIHTHTHTHNTYCSPRIMHLHCCVPLPSGVLLPPPPYQVVHGQLWQRRPVQVWQWLGLWFCNSELLFLDAGETGRKVGVAQGSGPLKCNLTLCSASCSQPLEPFCDDEQSPTRVLTSCTPDYLSVGRCNLVQYNGALDPPYRVRPFTHTHKHTHTFDSSKLMMIH